MIHLKSKLLAVQMPEGATHVNVLGKNGGKDSCLSYYKPGIPYATSRNLQGVWQLIGTLRQVWESNELAVQCGFASGDQFRTFIREHPECLNEGFLATPDQWMLLIQS